MRAGALVVGLCGVLAIGGCGSGADRSAATVTVTETPSVTSSTESSVKDSDDTGGAAASSSAAPASATNDAAGQQNSAKGKMPDVVCLDLQTAQNTIQKNGVYFSRSEDATGRAREQVWDRNWVVVAQRPAAGEPIGEGEAVLSVVKKGEPNDC